jgi:hypothetical protein
MLNILKWNNSNKEQSEQYISLYFFLIESVKYPAVIFIYPVVLSVIIIMCSNILRRICRGNMSLRPRR